MTKILTALTFALALGLSIATASAGYEGRAGDPANPIENVGK